MTARLPVNYYPLREGIAELEKMSQLDGLLKMQNKVVTNKLTKMFGVDVDFLTFTGNSIKAILSEVQNKLIIWLLEQKQTLSFDGIDSNTETIRELSNLHPLVQKIAGELFRNGHYRQAILDTYIGLVEAVKAKSGQHQLDNTPLMQKVFSPKEPILRVSSDSDEQLGFLWLFTGAIMGIRNPKAHKLLDQNDPQRAIEWLSFASVLLRIIDESIKSGEEIRA